MSRVDELTAHPVIVQVLADSFGGVMYNGANVGKYDGSEVLALWDQLDGGERDLAGGLVSGAVAFLQGAF